MDHGFKLISSFFPSDLHKNKWVSKYSIVNFRNQILAIKLVKNLVENDSIKVSVS